MKIKNFYPLKEEQMFVFLDYLVERFGSIGQGVKIFPEVMSFGWMDLLSYYIMTWKEYKRWRKNYSNKIPVYWQEDDLWMSPPREFGSGIFVGFGGGWFLSSIVSEEKLRERLIWLVRLNDQIRRKMFYR